MTEQRVHYSFADGAARITMSAGDRGNPIEPVSTAQLHEAVLRAKADGARVIVLAAEGRFFSVGGDLSAFADADDPSALLLELAEGVHRVITELVRGDAIVVSVVQGTAAGGGSPLAAAADIVLAADTAKFSLAYAKVGLSPDCGGSLLVHTLGLHRLLRLALLGDLVTAQEAYDAGLVARVVPAEELAATVDQVVGSLIAGSPGAFAAAKRLVRDAAEPAPETALRREAQSISTLAGTPDGQEGIAAFLEKRSPRYS
ncbi:enoyl-CoA hydratase/isomerase family protein [Nocardioides stalactiti]|uniref:enoyl-CoA hydratase/isomerase family protein n=1 Tax=Nocardioides stalactiti TaxID=2755356 RepID=UPI0016024A95|nr:enoyl-CoA hydratase-related protein [Nocardioides stalactiti]